MKFRPFNSIAEGLLYIFILVLVIFNIANAKINSDNARQAKETASQVAQQAMDFQKQTLERSQANKDRQVDMIEHFDCVIFLQKKFPNINFEAMNYNDSKTFVNKECPTINQ